MKVLRSPPQGPEGCGWVVVKVQSCQVLRLRDGARPSAVSSWASGVSMSLFGINAGCACNKQGAGQRALGRAGVSGCCRISRRGDRRRLSEGALQPLEMAVGVLALREAVRASFSPPRAQAASE